MPTIEVSEETMEKLKEQFAGEYEQVEINSLADLVGQKIFFRTVTVYLLGKVKKQVGKFLVLEKASWIADTKKYSDFIKDGIGNSEVEYIGKDVFLNTDSIVDFVKWSHDLPNKSQ